MDPCHERQAGLAAKEADVGEVAAHHLAAGLRFMTGENKRKKGGFAVMKGRGGVHTPTVLTIFSPFEINKKEAERERGSA